MSCEVCNSIVERDDIPHVVRKCKGCGRNLHVVEPGPHGRGIQIRASDQFVMPQSAIAMSLNPLQSKGQFTRYGLAWFAERTHLADLPTKRDEMPAEIERLEKSSDDLLKASPLLAGFDLENPAHTGEIVVALQARRDSSEWWAFLQGSFISLLRSAIEAGDPMRAVWAMGCVERCRAMLLFKQELEEVVWMGQSAKRIVDLLAIWDAHKENADEAFWQATLSENVYALSQLFAVPLVFVGESAYVGGMGVDRKSARLVDYLFSHESSKEAVLVEIKTPTAALLGKAYRGTFRLRQSSLGL
jgi:hypothetical protein